MWTWMKVFSFYIVKRQCNIWNICMQDSSSVIGIKPQTTPMEALKVAGNKWYLGCRRCYFAVLCMVLLLPLMTVRCSRTVLGSPYQGVGAAASCPQVTRLMCSVHQSLAPVSSQHSLLPPLYRVYHHHHSLALILSQHPALPKGTSKCTANLYATRLWCSKWEDHGNRNVLPGQISDTRKSCFCTNNYIISVLKCVKAWL